MARKANTLRAELPERRRAGDRFSVYADHITGAQIRRYCIKHNVTFTELALAAIEYFMEHRDPPKRQTLDLPRGSRLRPSR